MSLERYDELKAKGALTLERTGDGATDPVRVVTARFDAATGEAQAPEARLIYRTGLANDIARLAAEISARQALLDGLLRLQADIVALDNPVVVSEVIELDVQP